eukprot:UN02937
MNNEVVGRKRSHGDAPNEDSPRKKQKLSIKKRNVPREISTGRKLSSDKSDADDSDSSKDNNETNVKETGSKFSSENMQIVKEQKGDSDDSEDSSSEEAVTLDVGKIDDCDEEFVGRKRDLENR